MIGHLDSDDASFLLGDLEDDRRARILNKVSATDRAAIESSLAFDEESAGRLMQRDFVAAPVFWTVGQAIDHMRSVAEDDLPETFFEIYIVDPAFRLQGSVPVSRLLRHGREKPLKDIMKEAADPRAARRWTRRRSPTSSGSTTLPPRPWWTRPGA